MYLCLVLSKTIFKLYKQKLLKKNIFRRCRVGGTLLILNNNWKYNITKSHIRFNSKFQNIKFVIVIKMIRKILNA